MIISGLMLYEIRRKLTKHCVSSNEISLNTGLINIHNLILDLYKCTQREKVEQNETLFCFEM